MTTRIACLGDSLTRAQFSVDYMDLLGRRHPPGDVQLARFGANGDFAYNLLQRLEEASTCGQSVAVDYLWCAGSPVWPTGDPVVAPLVRADDQRERLAGRPAATAGAADTLVASAVTE